MSHFWPPLTNFSNDFYARCHCFLAQKPQTKSFHMNVTDIQDSSPIQIIFCKFLCRFDVEIPTSILSSFCGPALFPLFYDVHKRAIELFRCGLQCWWKQIQIYFILTFIHRCWWSLITSRQLLQIADAGKPLLYERKECEYRQRPLAWKTVFIVAFYARTLVSLSSRNYRMHCYYLASVMVVVSTLLTNETDCIDIYCDHDH